MPAPEPDVARVVFPDAVVFHIPTIVSYLLAISDGSAVALQTSSYKRTKHLALFAQEAMVD